MSEGNLASKWESFGWKVFEIDGHDMASITESLDLAAKEKSRPVAIIANTVKGKGVSYMENNPKFHGAAPNEEQFNLAMEELS